MATSEHQHHAYGVPARPEHVAPIAADMRQADRDEIWAARHLTPETALRESLAVSVCCWTMLADGEPAAMFGVSGPLLGGVGCPWLLGTALLNRHWLRFLRESRDYVGEMLALYPELRNCVDARHVVAIRWLKWLGFTFEPPRKMGVERLDFHPFSMRRK